MKLSVQAGATSQSVNLFVRDSSSTTGAGLTGLVFNTAGLTAYYSFAGANATATAITLATLAAVNSAYSSGGFKEIDATNMPGWYRLDVPNAALATAKGRSVALHLKGATNMAPLPVEIELTGWDNQDATRGGLTALPNANAGANGGLPLGDASARVLLQPTQTGVTIPTVTTVGTVTTLTNLPSIPNNWLTAVGIAAGALNGKGDWNTAVPPTAVQIRQEIDTNSVGLAAIFARTDVATSSRLAAASYTAPDNTSITWLKNYLSGDRSIDTGVSPWAEVVTIAGTSTELIRKKLRDVAGGSITATTTVIGSAKDS